ncbi:inositol monophosphatase family protein [Frigoribacterium faeni]|uniref:inositol monophosphatase family protein n=1 Tax=Frigoribacterium faeni TaxID=145483 RepID=UPI001FACE17D|nr:inositol monophosphatase family protein [Frigoribacterium faeni]MCJ0702116.1 inositol monophosphatase family protein [Frigoribacterium faeni]
MNDVELAEHLVRGAADLAIRMRDEGVASERKTSNADLVSAADRAAEELIGETLARERPDDGLIGEEGAASVSRDGRAWVADPIDGTFNFLSGLASWCSAVALEVDGVLAVGAVHRPALDETWVADADGTRLNGRRVAPLVDRPLAECGVATFVKSGDLGDGRSVAVMARLLGSSATVRVSGSGTCDLADVAAGRIGLWVQADCDDWDWLPGRALVEGAGGGTEIVEHLGRRWHLAGSVRCVAEAVELVLAAELATSGRA